MQIELTYDNGTPLDTESILGRIKLSKGEESIEEDNTYLDSWLIALIEGLDRIERNQRVSIDLVEEPDPLELDWTSGRLTIQYKSQKLVLDGKEELRTALKESARSMASKFDSVEETLLLKRVLDFAAS